MFLLDIVSPCALGLTVGPDILMKPCVSVSCCDIGYTPIGCSEWWGNMCVGLKNGRDSRFSESSEKPE